MLGLMVATTGCSRAPKRTVERLALLPVDNFTGDPSLDWIAQAGTAVLSSQMSGLPEVLPLRVAAIRDAYSSGATRLLHLSVTKPNTSASAAFHFEAELEDLNSHKMVRVASANGEFLPGVDRIAHQLDANAHPFTTSNEEALAAWARGEFERAVTLDPDFGLAWESWVEQLAGGQNRDQAALVASNALARKSLRSPLERAKIQFVSATIARDMGARRAALTEIANIVPNDPAAQIAAAEGESLARHFPEAIGFYRRVLALDPGNSAALNGIGYAEGERGDLAAAAKILSDYGTKPDQAINSLDSLGEVHFMNGRFKEAEQYFDQVTARDPKFLNGAPLMKAAYARWLGGDLPGADALMRQYLDSHAKENDAEAVLQGMPWQETVWREATWLYATGRTEAALAKLMSVPDDQKQMAEKQKSVWRGEVSPPQDLTILKNLYETTNVATDGLVRTIYAAALAKAGKADEAKELLKLWPLPDSAGDPLLQSLVYPQFLRLRKNLTVH